MQIYIVLLDHKHKPCWPPEPADLGFTVHKNWDSGSVYKLLSGRYWWAVARQKESVKMASPSFYSPRAVLWASRCVPNLKPAPWAKAPAQANRLFLRKTGCISCLCGALRLEVCQELSLQLWRSCGTQECKSPSPPEPDDQEAFPDWHPQNWGTGCM